MPTISALRDPGGREQRGQRGWRARWGGALELRTELGRKGEGSGGDAWQGPHKSNSAGVGSTEGSRLRPREWLWSRESSRSGRCAWASNAKPGGEGALEPDPCSLGGVGQRRGERPGQDSDPLSPPADTCYVLSFSIIMLNTSLHNPNVRDKPPFERFVSMNRGINAGSDLPEDQLRVRRHGWTARGGSSELSHRVGDCLEMDPPKRLVLGSPSHVAPMFRGRPPRRSCQASSFEGLWHPSFTPSRKGASRSLSISWKDRKSVV